MYKIMEASVDLKTYFLGLVAASDLVLEEIVEVFKNIFIIMKGTFSLGISSNLYFLKLFKLEVFSDKSFASDIMELVFEFGDDLNKIAKKYNTDFNKIQKTFVDFISDGNLEVFIDRLKEIVLNMAADTVYFVGDLLEKIINLFRDPKLGDIFKEKLEKLSTVAWEDFKSTWDGFVDWTDQAVNDGLEWGDQAVNDGLEWGDQAVNDGLEWGDQAVDDALEWGDQAVNDGLEWGEQAVEDVGNAGGGIAEQACNLLNCEEAKATFNTAVETAVAKDPVGAWVIGAGKDLGLW